MTKGVLCRSVAIPKCCNDDRVFDPLTFLRLNKTNTNTAYALSVASRNVLKTVDGAHGYGCRTAERMNQGFSVRNEREPEGDEKAVYLGFYDANKSDFQSISVPRYYANVRYRPELDERAHFELELTLNADVPGTRADLKDDRRIAMEQLWAKMTGPVRYNIPVNDDGDQKYNSYELPGRP